MARLRMRPSTIATIIGVAAIGLGIIDSVQTRAHNRLSVAPYLVIDYSVSGQTDQTVLAISVSNEGVGPAVIKSMKVTLPPELGGGASENWTETVETLRERGARVESYWNYEGGEAVGVQRGRDLMRVAVPSAIAETLMPLLTKIDVELVYTSIYREEFRAVLR